MYFIFWCSFANSDKNGTNNWNQTFSKYLRLLEHTSVKISMSFTSWVLELVGFDFSKRIIFLCSFAAFDQAKFQCVALLNFWLIRLNSLLYVNVIFKKRPCLSSPPPLPLPRTDTHTLKKFVQALKTRNASNYLGEDRRIFWHTFWQIFAHQKVQGFIMPEKQVNIPWKRDHKNFGQEYMPIKPDIDLVHCWQLIFLTDYREHFC